MDTCKLGYLAFSLGVKGPIFTTRCVPKKKVRVDEARRENLREQAEEEEEDEDEDSAKYTR